MNSDKKELTGVPLAWYRSQNGTEDDRAHLLEVLGAAESALAMLWQLLEPLVARSVSSNLKKACSLNYWMVSDGLRHSIEWLRRMPAVADDGTHVWEDSLEAAVTNEPEVRNDQVARREEDPDGVRGSRQERDSLQDRAGAGKPFDEVKRLKYQLAVAQQQAARTRSFPPRRYRKGKRGRR